ncbi:MAG: hypothetical protein ACLQCU_17475 [Acidimicrobiales bacterium]
MLTTDLPENGFEQRLLEQLLAYRAELYGPAAPSAPRRARRLRQAGFGTGLAAAAAAVVIVLTHVALFGPPANSGIRGVSTAKTQARPSVATLAASLTLAARASVNDDVVFEHSVDATGAVVDSWTTDGGNESRTRTYYSDGSPQYDTFFDVSGASLNATIVDYPDRAWWTTSTPWTVPSTTFVINRGSAMSASAPLNAVFPQWLLTLENFTMLPGTQLVHGVETYELATPDTPGFQRSIWVAVSTNLPVQEVTSGEANLGNDITNTFDFLPRTSTNLALLQLSIPAGFSHSTVPLVPSGSSSASEPVG